MHTGRVNLIAEILSAALAHSHSTYGQRRVQEAAGEFCRWNPGLSPLLETHAPLFAAWFLFDWTPDANDPTLPVGVFSEDTPYDTWIKHLAAKNPHSALLAPAQQLQGAQFSFFQVRPGATPGTAKARAILTDEEFDLAQDPLPAEWKSKTGGSKTLVYALSTLSDITAAPFVICVAPELFDTNLESEILRFAKTWQNTPIRNTDLKAFAVEIFDTYHYLRSQLAASSGQNPENSGKGEENEFAASPPCATPRSTYG
jgi:hypothetical protein